MATNYTSYTPTDWSPGMPITEGRMDKLEQGVQENRDDAIDLNSRVSNISTQVNNAATKQELQDLETSVSSKIAQNTASGERAMTELQKVIVLDPSTQVTTYGLDNFKTDIEGAISVVRQTIGTKMEVNPETSEVQTVPAYNTTNTIYNAIETLISAIGRDTEGKLIYSYNSDPVLNNTIFKNLSTIQIDFNNARGTADTLTQRLYNMATDILRAQDTANFSQGQIQDAMRLDLVDENDLPVADSLTRRFDDILTSLAEHTTEISDINSDINSLSGNINDNYVKKADIVSDLISSNTDKPLSASMGKELRDMIGGTYNASNTVTSAINTAASTAETNAKTYADTNKVDKTSIYNDLNKEDAGFVLDARQGKALSEAISTLDTNIDNRLDVIETNLTAARNQTGIDEDTNEPIYQFTDLDNRFDSIEGAASQLRTDLNAIANELAMVDETTHTIKDTNTKIDDLEHDVQELAAEIAMGQDANGRLTGAETRIDAIETAIDHVQGENDEVPNGLKQRITTLETDLGTAENNIEDLDQRLDKIDGGEALTGNTLVSRVSAAESAITNLQNEPKSATEIVASLPQNGDPNKDYLLGPNEDGKYFYYKWIVDGADSNWKLISGGGSGEGNTSGFDLSAEEYDALEEHEENTDYYVTRADGVHHYRYVPVEDAESGELILTEIEIGQFVDLNKIKRYNIATTTGTVEGEEVTYLNLYQYDYNENSNAIDTERQPFTQVVLPKGGGGNTSTSINKLTRIGDQTIQKIVNSKVVLRVFYSSWDSDGAESSAGTYTLITGNTVVSSGTLNSGAQNVDLSQGWQDNTAGFYEFDVTDYCNVGNTVFNLLVTVNGVNLGKDWTVNIIDLHLESDAPDVLLINATESYNFPYTAFGALTKTLYIVIDDDTDNKITQTLSSVTSGRAAYAAIPVQAHGAHKIEMYLMATIGGIEQTTSSIIREYIWYDANNTEEPLILASPKNGQTITAQQYSTIEIPYQVYKKDASTIQVDYYVDNVTFDSVTLEDTNVGVLSYLAATQGAHTIKIMVDNDAETALIINLNITELDINVSPVAGAIIDFDPTMLTNSSTNRLPSWTVGSNTYSLTASDNFNWSEDVSGGGYKTDADGKAFVIKAGSYVDLNYPMFARNGSNNILTNGAEMKIIFKVSAVRDVNAIWYQNTGTLTEKTVGIQLGAHSGWLKTDKATDTTTATTNSEYPTWVSGTTYALDDIVIYKDTIYKCITAVSAEDAETNPKDLSSNWLSMGKIETEVLATNSYLYMPYSEEDKIELDININKYNANVDTNFIMSYEDGVPSKAYAYEYGAAGDGLYHDNTIRIGSNDCDIYIYHLRIYNKALTTTDILQNFIADGNGISEKVERYNRNCIYWDSTQEKYFTSPSATAVLDPIKLAEVMPDVKVLMLDTPVFTVGKKNFVQGSSLRCIHAGGGNVYKSRGDADNWLFTNGFHSGQGTTSDNYGQSSRNVDFLFEVDGVNYPTKKKNMGTYTPSSDYVSKVYIGENASTWNGTSWEPAREAEDIETCDNWKGDKCKISLTETSVPNNYFNLKVNVASSENVNNALFQKRYDDFLVYNAPAQTAQIAKHRTAYAALGLTPNKIKVKNSMEFVPAVLFVRENEPDTTKHTEFADTNWHFYALGNIGDSKKTDYTRAYDPDDMNEFTCENSDNNTNNGQFQSGVFMYQNVRAIETPYAAFDSEKTYNENDIVVNNGNIQIYDGSSWSNATLTGWTDSETPYFAPYTAPNTMQYLFPITSSEWNVQVSGEYVNYKHNTLVNEEFDGDHSFEFRYACRGDYRDGDLINETDGQDDDAQFDLNHDVMLALYEWIITATEEQYAAEAPQWFVKSAMEFFYAYTHYYTMMDNRAKNTFWHFAKTGTYIEVSRPVKALLHVYEESTDNGQTWVKATGTEIDPSKKYRTQYAFDLWAYDMDTALGIDNNGALVFPYGKEDGDYRTEGDPSSGYAFNGAGSIFWRRLKKTFSSELVDIMTQAKDCFKSEDLINEFDTYQNCYPEEIWRLDIERKYIRTFTGNSVDNSVTTGKQNPRFLTSMMQGRKKYQRRQWIRNQGVYFNSKYRLADITDNSNTIEFNCTTPADIENIAVTPSYRLQLTPYQDMYLNVQVGNGNYKDTYITMDGSKNLRAKANQVYTFDLSGNYQETRIYINGANHLSAIGNLAPMYPYSFDLRALAHIKTLNIGTEVSEYTNTKFTELKLPTFMPLLESLNIKNCHSVAGTIALATANNIRTVEATGTAISGVSLPDYTSIQTLHIPSTVTALNLYGARFLTDFKVYNNAGVNDYSTLYKLHIYDSDYSSEIDWIDIAKAILNKKSLQTELSLLKLSNATIENIQELEPFNEFKLELEEAGGILEFSGIINVTGTWSQIEKDNYAGTPTSTWPNLILNTTGTEQVKRKVTFRYNNKEYSTYITVNNPVPDPYASGDIELPVKDSDPLYEYTFGSVNQTTGQYIPYSGWKYPNASDPVGRAPVVGTSNIILEPFFNGIERTYTIRWFLDAERAQKIGEVREIPYGGGADVIIPTVTNIHEGNYMSTEAIYGQYETCTDISVDENGNVEYKLFTGWDKLPVNIQPDGTSSYYDIFAVWNNVSTSVADVFANVTEHALTPEQLLVLSAMPNSLRANAPYSNYDEAYQTSIQLGHDSLQPGNVIVSDAGDALYLSGSNSFDDNAYSTNFQPFKDKAFTFVIDYTFEDTYEDENTYSVLASCYHSANNVKHGFGIFKNNTTNAIEVGFGNMYEDATNRTVINSTLNSTMRNIVVLRHPAVKEDDTYERLYVYSSQGASTSTASNVTVVTLDRTANINFTSNAYLNIGQLLDPNRETAQESEDLTDRLHAKAKVHWAKYWDYDIGAGECQLLASWPHEQVTLSIASINKSDTSNTSRTISAPVPSLYLNTVNSPVHGIYSSGRISESDFNTTYNSYGWRDDTLRTIYNNRIFNALPIKLQAVAMKPSVSSLTVIYDAGDGQGMNAGYRMGSMFNTRDYVYAYSAANVLDDNSAYDREDTLLSPFKWKNTNVIVAYNYSVTSNSWSESTNVTSNYLNIRFPYKPISWGKVNKMRVYLVDSLSNIPSSVALSIGRDNLRSGDILITGQQAYIYVSNAEINKYGLYPESNNTKLVGIPDAQATQIDSTNAGSGGWLKATTYWTRSLVVSTNRASLASVQATGTPEVSSTFNTNVERKFNFIIAL